MTLRSFTQNLYVTFVYSISSSVMDRVVFPKNSEFLTPSVIGFEDRAFQEIIQDNEVINVADSKLL